MTTHINQANPNTKQIRLNTLNLKPMQSKTLHKTRSKNLSPEQTAEICVIVPFWSQSDAMNWDSNYAYLKILIPYLQSLLPNWLFIVLWPKNSYGVDQWQWAGDGFFNQSCIRYPWPYDTAVRTGAIGFDPVAFHTLEDTLAPTIYWLHQVESGTFITGGYRQSYNVPAQPALLAQHHYIIHKSLPYPIEGQFPRLWMQLGGAHASHLNVFNSDYCRQMFNETMADYASTQFVDHVVPTQRTLRFGLVDKTLRAIAQDIPPSSSSSIDPDFFTTPKIIYNHRFEYYKQPQKTAEAIAQLRASGRSVDVWITQSNNQKINHIPCDKVVGDPVREKYLRNIAVPGINVINSMHETFCISMMDSIALGQLPVAPNAITFPELVPQNYPYLFNSDKEQVAILTYLVDHFAEEYDKWAPLLKTHAAEYFAVEHYASNYAHALIEAASMWHRSSIKETTAEGLSIFFDNLKPGRYPLAKIANQIRKSLNLARQSMPERRVVREWSLRGGTFAFDHTNKVPEIVMVWTNGRD